MKVLLRAAAVACAIASCTTRGAHADAGRAGSSVCAVSPSPKLSPRRFVFPRDDGAHDAFAVEAWRTLGRLATMDGDLFDVSVTVSRYAIPDCANATTAPNAWSVSHIVTSAYTLFDERSGATSRGEHVEREGPLGARTSSSGANLSAAGLRIAESSRGDIAVPELSLTLRDARRAAITLREASAHEAIAFGPGGIVQTGSCDTCAAYAYAYPRAAAHGTIVLNGNARRVSGTMWFEHEFAHRELDPSDAGWDRFTVTFDDGRALDARFVRVPFYNNVVAISGMRESANGSVTYLDAGNIDERNYPPGTTWKSDGSGTTYPTSWLVGNLEVGELERRAEVFTGNRASYVMTPVDVSGQSDDTSHGHGFAELTGYGMPSTSL